MVAEKQRKPGVGSCASVSTTVEEVTGDDSLPWLHILGFKTAAILLSVVAVIIIGSLLFFNTVLITQNSSGTFSATESTVSTSTTTGPVLTRKPLDRSSPGEKEGLKREPFAEPTDGANHVIGPKQNAPSVNAYDNWREVDPDDAATTDRRDCRRPACRWISRYISSKLDWTIKPCHDFYSHVCSSRWFASDSVDEMNLASQNLARFMKDLKAYLLQKSTSMTWEKNAATFFKGCLQGDRSLSTLRPRFPIWPLRRVSGINTLAKLQAYCARFFRSHPLLETFVAPSGNGRRDVDSERFMLYADSPHLPLARFQILYPNAAEKDYRRLIQSLIEGKDAEKIAEGIIRFERALARVISKEFVTLANRPINMRTLLADDDEWNVLLKTAVSNQQEVRTLDRNYVFKLSKVLQNASSHLDVANYMIYNTIVHVSPLIRNLTFLIPLGMDKTIRGVSISTQGCLRLTEKAYEHGMRILGLMALGAKDWSHGKTKEVTVHGIVSDLKRALGKHVEEWYTSPGSRREALRRLRVLKVVALGATPHDELTYAKGEKVVTARDSVSLLEGSPRRDSATSNFFPGSIFDLTPKYVPETNTLYLPHAMFGILNNMTKPADPIFVPLIGGPVLEAMLAAVDARGSERIIGESGISAHWWESEEDTKSHQKKACFRNLYVHRQRELLISGSRQAFLDEFVARGAMLEPLYNVYHNRMTQHYPDGLNIHPDISADMLFFIIYTMSLCEQPGAEKYKLKHKAGIPARILVNAHLGSSERFRRVFRCKSDDEMIPAKPCSYWK